MYTYCVFYNTRVYRIINQFLIGLQIEEHADKKAAKLSGGTKRKLSYGISMLGAPKVVLLDEPSTGMDPQSKRFLWNTILGSFKGWLFGMKIFFSNEWNLISVIHY